MGLLESFTHKFYKNMPGHMNMGVRHPYVSLRFKNYSIPLLDAKRAAKDSTYAGTGPLNVQPLFLQSMQHDIGAMNGQAGSNSLRLVILDPAHDYLTSLVFQEIRELNYSGLLIDYGWRGKDNLTISRSPPLPLYLLEIGIEVHPNRGTIVTLDCVDQSHEMWVGSHNLSFKEDDSTSSVITQVLRKLHPRMDLVVEPMKSTVGALRNMEGQSAASYIMSLMEAASPVRGSSPLMRMLMRPPRTSSGKSVLEIKALQAEKAVRTYVFGRERQGEMMRFSPSINLRAMEHLAAARSTAVSIDPVTKTWFRDESIQNEDKAVGPKRVKETPQVPTQNTESPMENKETKELVKGDRACADTMQWSGTAVVLGDVGLKPYDYIKIIVLKNPPTGTEVSFADSNAIHWASSGLWQIITVTHQINDGQFVTNLELVRNAGFVGEGTSTKGIPIDFTFDKGLTDEHGEFISRVTPLENPDRLTGSAGVWNPV